MLDHYSFTPNPLFSRRFQQFSMQTKHNNAISIAFGNEWSGAAVPTLPPTRHYHDRGPAKIPRYLWVADARMQPRKKSKKQRYAWVKPAAIASVSVVLLSIALPWLESVRPALFSAVYRSARSLTLPWLYPLRSSTKQVAWM
jgi:hypothetical protein